MSSSSTAAVRQLVEKYVSGRFGAASGSASYAVTELAEELGEMPGKQGLSVFRVSARIADIEYRWIAKRTTAEEAAALTLLHEAQIRSVPEMLAHSGSTEEHLVLMPEYPGHHGDFGDALPKAIVECLAQIHEHFLLSAPGLPRTDRLSLENLFEYSLGSLEIYASSNARRQLSRVKDSLDSFASAARMFPQTLVHWDVHPGNIILSSDESVLIDWGLARMGPAMIDLANVVPWDSPDFRAYVEACERLSGRNFDREAGLAEYNWCRAITQLKYLPFAAKFGSSADVERMAEAAVEYSTGIA